jgi:hypothetical protein
VETVEITDIAADAIALSTDPQIHEERDQAAPQDTINVISVGRPTIFHTTATNTTKNAVQWSHTKKATRTAKVLAEAEMAKDTEKAEEAVAVADIVAEVAVADIAVTIDRHIRLTQKQVAMSAMRNMSVRRKKRVMTFTTKREKPRGWC